MMDWPNTLFRVGVGISMLAESEQTGERLLSPRAAMMEVRLFPTGVKSNLKSPVQTIFP